MHMYVIDMYRILIFSCEMRPQSKKKRESLCEIKYSKIKKNMISYTRMK